MNEIIARKKAGQKLSRQEIETVIRGVTSGEIPDYQVTALLMAICWRGMDVTERSYLTRAMASSGIKLDFSAVKGTKVDKHSTGGVGDKISLMLAPWLAAAGKKVPMISGRGLGFTGGTLDKLGAIPGYHFETDPAKLAALLKSTGCFIIGQSAEIAPADKKIYALRDVTATVDEISLITASILSKKLAEDLDELVMDVKCGSGAFMQTLPAAKELAKSIADTARAAGVKTTCLITAMDFPLGLYTGNAIETYEAFEFCRPSGIYLETAKKLYQKKASLNRDELLVQPLVEITVELAAAMLDQRARSDKVARTKAIQNLMDLWQSGTLEKKMEEWVSAQNGDLAGLRMKAREILDAFADPKAKDVHYYRSPGTGYLSYADSRAIGNLMVELGAGRKKSEDSIDDRVSLEMLRHRGEPCRKSDAILRIYKPGLTTADRRTIDAVLKTALKIGAARPKAARNILARL
ncbi:MAG: pyrimidine-nucleoside phosphorylase [Turneriella sp.]